jgi:AcrR family transcriptional regulator
MPARKSNIIARKAPKQQRAKATAEAILEATAHLLVQHGYDKLTTNHVAAEAGASIGSVYQYFGSKEALVAELVDRHIARMSSLIAGELARAVDLPFPKAVAQIMRALVSAYRVDPALYRVILEQVPRFGKLARIRDIDREFEALLHSGLQARPREVAVQDTRLCAFIMVQAAKAVTVAALLHHPEFLEGDRLSTELSRMFVRYAGRG